MYKLLCLHVSSNSDRGLIFENLVLMDLVNVKMF